MNDGTPPAVYPAIVAVMGDLAQAGISKDRKNTQQNYAFRGVEDVYNALAPLLARHKLCVLPRVLSRVCDERQSKSGGALFYVAVDVEYDFVSAVDGSKHVVRVAGEAMDSADKATNKAMSAAFKYMAFQAFCIPVEGTEDADASHHDVAPRTPPGGGRRPPQTSGRREPEDRGDPTVRRVESLPDRAHHASWEADRVRFCATLGEHGVKYDFLAEWCDLSGKPRPSAMDQAKRDTLLHWLGQRGWQLPEPSAAAAK